MKHTKSKGLIEKYLSNKASEQEQARLETWYLLKAEESPDDDAVHDFPETGKRIWANISNNLGDQVTVPGQKTMVLKHSYFRYAAVASVIICLGIGMLYYISVSKKADRFVVAKGKDIAPGTSSAILILSNGKKIDLTHAGNGVILTESGLEIIKMKNGQLVYRSKASQSAQTQINTIETPAGGQYMVVLPDGSKVWLNSKSSLTYPTRFDAQARKVILKGEGYFEVAHLMDKSNKNYLPFIVATDRINKEEQQLKVLGTHFNINSYDDEPVLTTTLLEGRVEILAHGQSAVLKPGQQSIVEKNSLKVAQADTDMAVAWKNGEFVFRENLESAMRKVSRWYGVEIVYQNSAPKQLLLGGWMSREKNISDVLDHIQSTGKVHFVMEGRRVIVSD